MTNPSPVQGAVRIAEPRPRDEAAQPPHRNTVPTELFAADARTPAETIGRRLQHRSPVTTGVAVAMASYAVLTTLLLAIGWLLTRVLFAGRPASWDIGTDRWFAEHRNGAGNGLTSVGSNLGATITVIGVAALVVAVLAWKRWWPAAAFLTTALCIEVTVFLTTTLVIDRTRPAVDQLDTAPPTSSFPSGHTAASIALYAGIALIATSTSSNRALRTVAWVTAIVAPISVMVSRLYRGMHFPTDVAAGAILGICSLIAALLVVRTSVAVARRRQEELA
jgi:membrane-associated phospholipid phosphatase